MATISREDILNAVADMSVMDIVQLVKDMEEKFAVTVIGGQDALKGKVIRIGHMGFISNEDMHVSIEAMAQAINLQSKDRISFTQLKEALASLDESLS